MILACSEGTHSTRDRRRYRFDADGPTNIGPSSFGVDDPSRRSPASPSGDEERPGTTFGPTAHVRVPEGQPSLARGLRRKTSGQDHHSRVHVPGRIEAGSAVASERICPEASGKAGRTLRQRSVSQEGGVDARRLGRHHDRVRHARLQGRQAVQPETLRHDVCAPPPILCCRRMRAPSIHGDEVDAPLLQNAEETSGPVAGGAVHDGCPWRILLEPSLRIHGRREAEWIITEALQQAACPQAPIPAMRQDQGRGRREPMAITRPSAPSRRSPCPPSAPTSRSAAWNPPSSGEQPA